MNLTHKTFDTKLKKLRELNTKNTSFINKELYKLILNIDVLVYAYEKIKSNPGATTQGTYGQSLDGMNIVKLNKLLDQLKTEKWKPRPAKRVYIQKPGKNSQRPLAIQGPEEKIVQAALVIILEAIYEPSFSENSFGFRPNRGAHDALKAISEQYDGMCFAIEADITGMFDNVNHHKLIEILQKRIQDARFIRLIWKLLRNGYLEKKEVLIKPITGTPQGSIVSPILANIYLHELDIFMENRCSNLPNQKNKTYTPKYKEFDNKIRVLRSKLDKDKTKKDFDSITRKQLCKDLKSLKIQALKSRPYLNLKTRVVYTRYADDFIIGIAGGQKFAETLKLEVKEFLKSIHLELNEDKTKLTNIRKSSAYFLGYKIYIHTPVKLKYVRIKKKSPFLRRVTGKYVKVEAPMDIIIKKLALKGFCSLKGFPNHKKLWITQEDHQIVDNFNMTIRGILNYYSGSSRRWVLGRIWYILQYSCAKTLANKHRCSIRKIFNKRGKLLKVIYGKSGEKSIELCQPSFKQKDKKWAVGAKLKDPYQSIQPKISKTKLYDSCIICANPDIEMHHIRHVKDQKANPRFYKSKSKSAKFNSKIMSLINRKQIPVCKTCHQAIHKGKYDGMKLSDLKMFQNLKR